MNEKRSFKRKRKESFVRKAKKYLKRGGPRSGHGTHVEQDVFEYFCRVLDVWNKGFDSEQDKQLFADNVLDQTQGNEMNLFTSQLTSRAIETVICAASADKVRGLEAAVRKDLRVAFVDRFCSHLTQNLILSSAGRVAQDEEEGEESFAFVCIKFAVNNIEEFAWHMCACHVVRTCLEAVSIMDGKITPEYPKLFYGALIESPAISDIVSKELGSGLFQVLLKCLSKCRPKLCQKAISALLTVVFSPEGNSQSVDSKEDDDKKEDKKMTDTRTLAPVFEAQPSIRLLECAIDHCTSKRFSQIYMKLFINRLQFLATDKKANLAVQALIKASQDKTEFEGIFDEISGSLVQVMNLGFTGVLVSLASACQRLGSRQGQFYNALVGCFNCESNELTLVERCLFLDKRRFFDQEESKDKSNNETEVSLQGSLLVQSLLRFQKPIKVINSLLEMDTNQLVKVLNHRNGCHVSDVFFTAEFVGEKSKDKFFNKIKDHLVDLVVTTHGSRSFDAIWNGVNMKHRQTAASKLRENESAITSTLCGNIIAKKIHLGSFRRDPKGWAAALSSANSAQRLFSDIIAK